jgi:hypothetical protein
VVIRRSRGIVYFKVGGVTGRCQDLSYTHGGVLKIWLWEKKVNQEKEWLRYDIFNKIFYIKYFIDIF